VQLTAALVAIAVVAVFRLYRRRRGLARLEARLRALRAAASRPIEHRAPEPGDSVPAQLAELSDQLRALGATELGDVVETEGDNLMRWFADADSTTFGWGGVSGGLFVAFLMSHAGERWTLTRFLPRRVAALAQPPYIDRAEHVGGRIADAFATHRARVPGGAIAVRTLDEGLRELADLRARTLAWREAQPPDQLLEDDLRAVLGIHFARLGPIMARRLGVRLPEARAL
jgi:hypothetical protein